MPTKARGPKFSGELNEPIVRTYPLALAVLMHGEPKQRQMEVLEAQKTRIAKEMMKKVPLLMKHYKISPNAPNQFFLLAMHLAHDFVPGMRVEAKPLRRRGRSKVWKGIGGKSLVEEIQKVNAKRKKGIADAARIVQRRQSKYRDYPPKALESRYYDALAQPDKPHSDEFFDLVKNALQSGTKIPL